MPVAADRRVGHLFSYPKPAEPAVCHVILYFFPALGSSGYLDSGWGFASTVRFDDIAICDTQSFAAQTAQLEAWADTPVILQESSTYASQLRYLINHGVLMPYQRNMDFSGNVSVAQFLVSAMY